MMTNYERVLKRFIPAFRLKAAKMMINEYGIKQQQAAMFLGTTQAAISKYMKDDPGKYTNVKIDNVALREFIENMKANDEKSSQKILCVMCQNNKKFDCSFMVK
jgi:predicted transcriptional regulator